MKITSVSLIVFTVLVQSAVGLVLVSEIARLRSEIDEKKFLNLALIVALIVAFVGLCASTTHLASPFSAIYIFNNIFTSALSLEILCAMLFLVSLAITVFLRFKKPESFGVLGTITTLLGFLLIWSIANVYMKKTIPTFDTIGTLLAFLGTALSVGAALTTVVYAFACKKYYDVMAEISHVPMVCIGFAILGLGLSYLGTPFNIVARSFMGNFGSTGLDSVMMAGQCPELVLFSIALPVFGVLLLVYGWLGKSAQRQGFHFTTLSLLAFATIFAGEICARYVFYESYLRLGL